MISSSKKKKNRNVLRRDKRDQMSDFFVSGGFFSNAPRRLPENRVLPKNDVLGVFFVFFCLQVGSSCPPRKIRAANFRPFFAFFGRKKNLQKNTFPSNDVISKQQNRPLLKLNNFESSFRFNTNYRVEK